MLGRFFSEDEARAELALNELPTPEAPVQLPTTKDKKVFFQLDRKQREFVEQILHDIRATRKKMSMSEALVEVFKFYDRWRNDTGGNG